MIAPETTTPTTSSIERVLTRVSVRPEALAALRRGVGRPLEESPDSWPYVMEVAGGARWREEAAHVTLGLFALHHQSQLPGAMNQAGQGLGAACGRLKRHRGAGGGSEEGVERRFHAALAAETPEALAVHLRGLVTLLRGVQIPLDYAGLYRDLIRWRYPDERNRVCLGWARQYFRTSEEASRDESKETSS